jgi:hypothetical protein
MLLRCPRNDEFSADVREVASAAGLSFFAKQSQLALAYTLDIRNSKSYASDPGSATSPE